MDDKELIEGVAREYGIGIFRRYSEPQAAKFLQCDVSTLKRMRRAGKVNYTALGERQIRYLGIHLVQLIVKGDKWRDTQSETSKLVNTGSPNEPGAAPTTERGLTQKPTKPDEYPLAQAMFRKPAKP